MKQKLALTLALLMLLLLAAGCGAKSMDMAYDDSMPYDNGYYNSMPAADAEADLIYEEGGDDMSSGISVKSEELPAQDGADSAASTATVASDKIIYTAYAYMETTDFEKTLWDTEQMIERYGAFIETSSVDGIDYRDTYYNNQTYRSAHFTIRVPVERFEEMTEGLSSLGHVTSLSRTAENVSAQYTDLQSRLTAYQTEEKSLLAMMEKAETVTELLEIEKSLSDVRYEIEYYTTSLRNLQNQISYSTVTLQISEVEELSEVVEVRLSYWEQIGAGFTSSLKSVGRFFKNLFSDLVSNLPMILLVLAIIAFWGFILFLVIRLVCRRARKRRAKRAARLAQAAPAPVPSPDPGGESNG